MESEIQINNTAGVCQIDIEGTIGVPEEWQFEEPDARVATYERFRDTLRRIADYFGVSIDYLLGHKTPAEDDERQLLARYRSFTPSQKRLLLDQAELITRYKVKVND